MNNKIRKYILITLSIIGVFLVVLGVTYAYWILNKEQTRENVVTSACLDVTLDNESDDINLTSAYPILDVDGEKLEPYKFTITNNCNDVATYQINLESLTTVLEANRLSPNYIKVKLNEVGKEGIENILGEISSTDTTIENTYEAHKLMNGFLNGKQAKNFELRLWVAEKVTVENTDSMNKEFRSKISVTSTLPNDEDVPPSSELKLLSCNDTIIAKAIATPYKDKTITKYEYKIDENEWQDGSDEIEFTEQEQGNHTIKLRVTDNLGVVSDEVEQTINVDIKETEYTSIYGRQIPVASCLNGLYKVEHNINSDWNKEEYRYVGVSEKLNNYVKFNNEIWRIIGLVNVKTSSGQMEQRLKIIRQDGIEGQKDFGSYVWDGKNKGVGSSLSTYGSNDWTDSRVKDMLNGLYYNSIDGYCYDRSDWYYECGFTGKDDKVKGLDATARNMVDGEIVWSLGGARSVNITPDDFYVLERGSDVYGDNIEWSKSTDVGNNYKGIGLIYPSDFGYATNGGFLGWEKCININFTYWSLDEDYRLECKHNDWLNPTSGTIWTITNNSYNAYQVFGIDTSTSSYYDQVNPYGYAFHEGKIWPTLYLKKNISIVNDDNDGSIEKPYELQLNG